MGMLIHPELTLNCGLSSGAWIPKTIREFLADVARIDDVSDRILKLEDYVNRLQDEMKKIDPFRKELPLSMILLGDVIAKVKEELQQYKISKAEPVLEEFIPLKKTSSDDEKNDKSEEGKESDTVNSRDNKMNWMSSVQLWNSDVQTHPNTDHFSHCKLSAQNLDNNNKKRKEEAINHSVVDDLFPSGKNRTAGRTFAPFKGCTNFPVMMIGKEGKDEFPGLPALSLRTPEIKDSKEEIMHSSGFSSKSSSTRSVSSPASNVQSNFKALQQQSARKQRRCWSPELHRRFVNALQQLGGAQAATPKQIRELMQVDGLTNDEVKSHLQKYRLHTRKVPPTDQPALVGGLWMSREQSGLPQDTLGLPGSSRGTSTSGGDSVVEDEDDGKSESHSETEKSQNHLCGKDSSTGGFEDEQKRVTLAI